MDILITIGTIVVALILLAGLYTLLRGGEVARNYSNKLMRARVIAQAVVILLVMLTVYFTGR